MKIYKLTLIIMAITSCQVLKNNGTHENINNIQTGTGDVNIINPDYSKYYYYSYMEIKPNVDYYTILENNLTLEINILKEKIEGLIKAPNNSKSTVEQERKKLEQKQFDEKKAKELKNKWNDVGFYNREFRLLNYPKFDLKLNEYIGKTLAGLSSSDYIETCVNIYGIPNIKENGTFKYTDPKNNVIFEVRYNPSNAKISFIQVFGIEGYRFVKSKGISDKRLEIIGQQRSKIVAILGKDPEEINSNFNLFNYGYYNKNHPIERYTFGFYVTESKNYSIENIFMNLQ